MFDAIRAAPPRAINPDDNDGYGATEWRSSLRRPCELCVSAV